LQQTRQHVEGMAVDPWEKSRRKILVFTGKQPPFSTIEAVEAIASAHPDWHVLVLQDSGRPLHLWPYLKRKVRRLRREPLSYPLELLSEAFGRFRIRKRTSQGRVVGIPGLQHLGQANVSHRLVDFRDASAEEIAKAFAPWLGISLAAPILYRALFSLPELGTINVHKSFLPEYRGMPPGFWELHDGATATGVSVHRVTEGLDTGDILDQVVYPLPCHSEPDSIGPQLDELAIPLLLTVLKRLDDGEELGCPQGVAGTPTRSRPAFLLRQRLRRKLRARRSRQRHGMASLRQRIKTSVLWLFVHLYAPVRNLILSIRGTAHVSILLYHRVDDSYLDDVTVGVAQFVEQMRDISRRYDILDMREFLSSKGSRRRRPAVVITFDDGYASAHLAARLLRREGIPATFFVSTGLMDSEEPFPHDKERLGKTVPALSWGQISEMANWGFHIAPHTVNHTNVGKLPTSEAVREITGAMEQLDAQLGQGNWMPWFAYPHGKKDDISDAVRSMLPSMGLTCCFSAYGETNRPEFDLYDIKRQGVDWKYSLLALHAVVEGWKVRT